MSKEAPDVTDDASKKVIIEEDTSKNYDGLSKEDLVKLVIKNEKIKEDKHNFALSEKAKAKENAEKLSVFEQERADAELKRKEEQGAYEELKLEYATKHKILEDRNAELEASNAKSSEGYASLSNKLFESNLKKLPEDKREWATEFLKDKTGEDKINALESIASQFGSSDSFGKVPPQDEKKKNELDELLEKKANATIRPSELLRLKELTK